jgi:ribonuclease R
MGPIFLAAIRLLDYCCIFYRAPYEILAIFIMTWKNFVIKGILARIDNNSRVNGKRMGKKTRIKKDPHAKREAEKYEHPIPSREFILDFLKERDRPASFKQLSQELRLFDETEKEALRRRLSAMVRDGQLMQNRRGAFGSIDRMELIVGHVVGHKDGFGFVVPEHGGDDIFLNARQMKTVFPEDKVLVRVAGLDFRGRQEGVITEVLERHTHELVGRLTIESGAAFVEPADRNITHDILVPPDAMGSAQHGQMVVIEITAQPSPTTRPVGRIVEIIGDHMAPGMEIDVAIRNHDLPHIWPDAALKEAATFSKHVSDDIARNRTDIRDYPFVTIDGEDAKDFDDAVYCKPNKTKNGWTLYVAIADVSHYVRPKTALDQEAFNRGNSVYFPNRVIPMLPEILSNELCSLNPHVNRLAMVCEMSISAGGKITSYRFYEAMIKSHARLTYNQVYNMVVKSDKPLQDNFKELMPHLNELFSVYRVLHSARIKRGAIDFDLPETKIIFGKDKKIERIIAMQRNDAHRLIEECMLCANICTARFLLKNECPGLYRIHEGPSAAKLADLHKFLGELGLKLSGQEDPSPRDYASLLKSITGRPDAHLIQTVLLRSLSQAMYSSENKGHFGLAYDAYTHFTSPIRRYPDLIVHRSIRNILSRKFVRGENDPLFEKYGEHCSMTERRADEATREAIDWLKCEYMLDKVGEEFAGVISGVTSFGLFVELSEIYVEGLIHISNLKNDYYQFDPIKHALRGERSGTRYRIGDVVHVKVVRVNLDNRQIDFMLAEELQKTKSRTKKTAKKKTL